MRGTPKVRSHVAKREAMKKGEDLSPPFCDFHQCHQSSKEIDRPRLITVVLGLVRTVDRDAEVFRLNRAQLVQLRAHVLEV